ncbi:unnamed protein product [Nippostrongylus brasiliensis]|uniref:Uncharacterized protein n=1 Tax=Nippostrongylus brasiliensis TaxID=27835 RepID=A0A0N4YHD5_NIPBR|nr:unnamed protein product [Nippostrongylus brasiliensis]
MFLCDNNIMGSFYRNRSSWKSVVWSWRSTAGHF